MKARGSPSTDVRSESPSPPATAESVTRVAPRLGLLAGILLASAVLMTMYQLIKNLLAPNLTVWESQFITILFGSLLATLAGFVVLNHREKLLRRAQAEVVERRRMEVTLRESEKRSAGIVETVESGIVIVNPNGQIEFANLAAERILGISRPGVTGRTHDDASWRIMSVDGRPMPPDDLPVAQVLRTGSAVHDVELSVEQPSGARVRLSVDAAPLRDSGGAIVGVVASFTDVTDRKRAEELRQQLAAIVDSSDDAILSETLDGLIVSWNAGAERLYGYAAHEIVGSPLARLIPADRADEVKRVLDRIVGGERVDHFETLRVRKDGTQVPVSLTVSPLKNAEGAIAGASIIARDITDRMQAEETVRLAKEEAERANLAKSEFISRMSHELRTPLNAILGFGQLLEMDDLPSGQDKSVRQILKAGRHLLDLINEILDISSIESGRMALSSEPVNVGDALAEAMDLIRPLTLERTIQLDDLGVGSDRHVLADRQRLKQVLLNLLSNAVKYNRDGGSVTVSVEVVRDGVLRVAVTDTGPGIPPASLDKLFMPFERLGAEHTGLEGTGIGLALSKRLVQLMGGEIGVESTPDQGSTFWIEMPLVESPVERLALTGDAMPTLEDVNGDARTLLYIEDNLSNLELIQRILQRRPAFKLISTMQGGLGLDLAREHQPDLILLDVHLPDMLGDEVLRLLKEDPRTTKIPVVIISADATPGRVRRLLAAGAQDYLTKPIDVRRFLDVLDASKSARVA
jgi:PAS domain S-box-containing protein